MRIYILFISLLVAVKSFAQAIPQFDATSGKYAYVTENSGKLTEPVYDHANYFGENNRASVKRDGKWFLINTKFEEITPRVDSIDMNFHRITEYTLDMEMLKKDCCFYLYDLKKKKASPGFASLNMSYTEEFYMNDLLVVNTRPDKIALVNIKTLSMSPQYDAFFIDPYYNYTFDDFWFRKDDKVYRADKNGTPMEWYDYVEPIDVYNYEDYFSYKRNGLWNVYDKKNSVPKRGVTDENYFGMPWNDQYIFRISDDEALYKDGLFGGSLFTLTVRPPTGGEEENENTLANFLIYADNNPILFKREKFGYMDRQLNVVIPVEYDSAYSFNTNLRAAVKKNGRWGIIQEQGMPTAEFAYESIAPTRDPAIFIAKKDGKFGLITPEGKNALPFAYDRLVECSHGYIAKKDGTYGMFDNRLQERIPFVYGHLSQIKSGYLVFGKKGLVGIYGLNEHKEIFSGPYKSLQTIPGQKYLVHKGDNGLCELLDFTGKVLISGNYEGFGDLGNGYIAVKKYNGTVYRSKYRLYNLHTQTLFPDEYDDMSNFSEGLSAVRVGDKYGYINERGEWVIPAIFTHANAFKNEKAYVQKGKKFTYIDKTGQEIKNKNLILK